MLISLHTSQIIIYTCSWAFADGSSVGDDEIGAIEEEREEEVCSWLLAKSSTVLRRLFTYTLQEEQKREGLVT